MRGIRISNQAVFVAAALALATACGGGGGGSDDVTISGVGRIPASEGGGVTANQSFVVNDLAAVGGAPLAAGMTDDGGNYQAIVEDNKEIFVVINAAREGNGVRVSGLMDPGAQAAKDFDGVTDIACEAGVTAVAEGALDPEDMDQGRIANLEAGALTVAAGVDFSDPASVTAAAATVRTITDDGDHPPL